ncbi:MAG: hypothetical protein ABI683_14375 [Ginsengibacter sp.]
MTTASLSSRIIYLFVCVSILIFSNCTPGKQPQSAAGDKDQQLATLDSLLRDSAFAVAMATTLDSSYYAGIGQESPPFLLPADDSTYITTTKFQEKVATNLAGFYALECGINMISSRSGEKPVAILKEITSGAVDSDEVFLLNRFANATWKASQPFRGLGRITRSNFIVASSLSKEEVDKDYVQIKNAAVKLLSSLESKADSSMERQMIALRGLLQDSAYAVSMASFLDSSYYVNLSQPAQPFFTTDDTAIIKKTSKGMKIATSIAGFYALECGVNYLVTKTDRLPADIIKAVANDAMTAADKNLFARFANATWKAGQPFRGISRITRTTFTPFYFLTQPDIDKDLVQVRAAARKVLPLL